MISRPDTETDQYRQAVDYNRSITDDYECKKDCRNCPFPGAKCYPSKYEPHKKSHDNR